MTNGSRLSDLARHLILPDGIETTEWPRMRRAATKLGIGFDEWQDGLLTAMFGKRADGKYAAGSGGVVLSVCRQTGKTYTIGRAMLLRCLAHADTTVLWTAHRTRTSDDTFQGLSGYCEASLARWLKSVRRANGQQEISFANGSRILFGAREQGFGRGFSGVDFEVFDEAQILTERAMDDMVPAMNAAPNPLLILMGTPPAPNDPGSIFRDMRSRALAKADGIMYVEFSADRDARPDDRAQWRKANPSYPGRTDEGAMIRMLNTLGADSFRREALGIWDETGRAGAITRDAWHATEIQERPDGGTVSFGLDMPPDRSEITIGAAARYADGTAYIELAECRSVHEHGSMWAVDWIAQRWPRTAAVVIDAQSPAISILPDLKARHVRVTVTGTREMGQATGRVIDMLGARTLTHLPDDRQPALADAAMGATLRGLGQGGLTAWQRTGIDLDISPLVACTLALHGAFTSKRHPGRRQAVG